MVADNQIYCYTYDPATAAFSYFVRLASGDVLTIEKVTHAAGGSPCSLDPSAWAFDGTAVNFIR